MVLVNWEFEKKKQGLEITYCWMKDFLEKISKQNIKGFYPTGSVYFGLDNDKSDLDFIVKKEIWRSIDKESHWFYGKKINPIYHEYEFESIKFLYKNRIFNFIIAPDNVAYKIWVMATKIFKLLLKNVIMKKIMKDKSKRVEFFEMLKDLLREYYKE